MAKIYYDYHINFFSNQVAENYYCWKYNFEKTNYDSHSNIN